MLVKRIQREPKDATDRVKVSRSKPTGVGSGRRHEVEKLDLIRCRAVLYRILF